MRNRTYGGVRGRKMKVGRKLSFSSYSIIIPLIYSNKLRFIVFNRIHRILHLCAFLYLPVKISEIANITVFDKDNVHIFFSYEAAFRLSVEQRFGGCQKIFDFVF